MAIQVIILAAGQSKRMVSNTPKVLHLLGGKPLLEHVVNAAREIAPATEPLVVYGYQGERVQQTLQYLPVRWIAQQEQLGTAHAVLQALPYVNADDHVLILYGDVPLITAATLKRLQEAAPAQALGMLTAHLANPGGYGRIKRDAQQRITSIIEEKDATAAERAINEINPGVYLVPTNLLQRWLPALGNKNSQKEFYLTDIIARAVQENITIHAVQPTVTEEVLGVNDRLQLAQLERYYQQQLANVWLQRGVTIYDPARFDVRGEVQIGRDVTIDINVVMEGRVVIGNECVIGPNVVLRNTHLADRVEVKANSVIDGAEIAADCIIGPFARVRPGTVLAPQVHIGNFVEIKNSDIGHGSKINHLSYVGDSEVGKQVNVGAGTITCNYDGMNKHKTVIGDHVHIGSDTQLVAPVTVGEGATIGAGSTITKDVPAHQLTLTHKLEQRNIKTWQRPEKEEKC